MSFADYLRLRYKADVTDNAQPLLVYFDIHREQVVYLVPELCQFIGITDEVRNEKSWVPVKRAKRTDAPVKIKESTSMVTNLMKN